MKYIRNLKCGAELLYLGLIILPLAGVIVAVGNAGVKLGLLNPDPPNNDGFEF